MYAMKKPFVVKNTFGINLFDSCLNRSKQMKRQQGQ